jgi:hypothetical protein
LRLTTRRGREEPTTTTALKVHALQTELDAIEAKAVAEARDLAPDEAERVDATREQAKAMLDDEALVAATPDHIWRCDGRPEGQA